MKIIKPVIISFGEITINYKLFIGRNKNDNEAFKKGIMTWKSLSEMNGEQDNYEMMIHILSSIEKDIKKLVYEKD